VCPQKCPEYWNSLIARSGGVLFALCIAIKFLIGYVERGMDYRAVLTLFFSKITLEDILEALLQEQTYDETDKVEQEAKRIA
jgi:hypothetical protein